MLHPSAALTILKEGRHSAGHLATAPKEGIFLPELTAIATYKAHTAIAVGKVQLPH